MRRAMKILINPFNKDPSAFETRPYSEAEKKVLFEYMQSFECCIAAGKIFDCVTGEHLTEEDIGWTDGEFLWSSQDMYHIAKYNAAVKDEFLAKAQDPGFTYVGAVGDGEGAFREACASLELKINGLRKGRADTDEDGSLIQTYTMPGGRLKVISNSEIEGVVVNSSVNLDGILPRLFPMTEDAYVPRFTFDVWTRK